MDNATFNKLVRPLNVQYRDVFGHIPRIIDYSCTREEYLEAMKASIECKNSLESFLTKRGHQFDTENRCT